MQHPNTRRKDFRRKYSVLEVLTDFILDVNQVDERSQEYPINNAEKRFRDETKRQENELSVVYDEQRPNDENYRTPPCSIEEHAFNTSNPVENAIFREPTAETVEYLTALLKHVKDNEEVYVERYADPNKPWNEESPHKKRTPKNVRQAIRNLELERVRECRECGGAFYAHDRRQIVCDLQKYKDSKLSMCQIKNKRKNEKKARKTQELRQKKANM